MTTKKLNLKPGTTVADVLDQIEEATVKRLCVKHGMTEENLRKTLLDADHPITQSYHRKNARTKQALIDLGMSPAIFY